MQSNLDKYKADLKRLIDLGGALLNAMQWESSPVEFRQEYLRVFGEEKGAESFNTFRKALPQFREHYQNWYSEARILVRQVLPDRLVDFTKLYEKPKNRKQVSYDNYVIEDYLQGLAVTRGWEKELIVKPDAAIPKFQQQLNILKSIERRFESSLFDITQLLQADLFDSELDAAQELKKNGFLRAAGAMAGVVLERHLTQVCGNHGLSISKKAPHISDLNDLLKQSSIIDVATWRFIQHLGDIRNLCDHSKKTEPTTGQVEDLINGVAKISKTIF